MTFKPKTAKELPPGAEVYGRGITYTKTTGSEQSTWPWAVPRP